MFFFQKLVLPCQMCLSFKEINGTHMAIPSCKKLLSMGVGMRANSLIHSLLIRSVMFWPSDYQPADWQPMPAGWIQPLSMSSWHIHLTSSCTELTNKHTLCPCLWTSLPVVHQGICGWGMQHQFLPIIWCNDYERILVQRPQAATQCWDQHCQTLSEHASTVAQTHFYQAAQTCSPPATPCFSCIGF